MFLWYTLNPLYNFPMFSTKIFHVSPRFAMYQLTALTACAMSGLLQIITNIKLPTIDAYGTRDIYFLFTSLLGHILEDNLKLTRNEIKIGLQSCILKHNIFFK